jgi:hypothetical protein
MAEITIPDMIEIGDVSTYLAANYEGEGSLFGERLAVTSPQSIQLVTDALRWQYESFPDDSTIRGVANYLQWMCGKFGLTAQYVINGAGGGSVIPIFPTANPDPVEFSVSPTSIIPSGGSSASISSFIGFNVIFVRGGITQSTLNTGGSYFTWNKGTGTITCNPVAYNSELFQIYPTI